MSFELAARFLSASLCPEAYDQISPPALPTAATANARSPAFTALSITALGSITIDVPDSCAIATPLCSVKQPQKMTNIQRIRVLPWNKNQ